MPKRRDGEVINKGTIRGEDLERGLLKRVFGGKRTVINEGTDLEETKIELTPDEARRMLVGDVQRDVHRQRDGLSIQVRGGEVRRFNRTRELREIAGLSIDQLAAEAYLPPALLAKIEDTDEGLDVQAGDRERIAAALGRKPDDVWVERRAGAGPKDFTGGLPSLSPEPVRPLAPLTEGELRSLREQEIAAANDAVRTARDAEQLTAAEAALTKAQRKLTDFDYRLGQASR